MADALYNLKKGVARSTDLADLSGGIENNDIASGADIEGSKLADASVAGTKLTGGSVAPSKLAANARREIVRSKVFNIDNGAGTADDDIVLVPTSQIVLLAARVVYTEATDGTGADGATVAVGTTVGGTELVTTTSLSVSKATGSFDALTLAATTVTADAPVVVRHTGIAATEGGQYYVQFEYVVDD